ncbi:hypothetical protein Tco_0893190 [Tanacetum coccineum]|uniref:Reverse transcriptase domain-containing protein n=1 Tax=Tanacetum coccineum TaxID=301880 RepID=A0ABQ5CB04_9ASTR
MSQLQDVGEDDKFHKIVEPEIRTIVRYYGETYHGGATPCSHEWLTQVDTFYNGLNDNEQDSLNDAAGGNLLSKTTREALNIIENKSKECYSRSKLNASRMNATSSKTDERIDKLADQLSTLVECHSRSVERKNRETKQNKEQTNFQGSTAQIPPPVIPISVPEPDVLTTLPKITPILESDIPKSLPKPNIPYPSRRDDLLAINTIERELLGNASQKASRKSWRSRQVSYSMYFPRNRGMPRLGRSWTAEEFCSQSWKFHCCLPDFVVVDFEADPRVPLILGRSFLRTGRALIDVYGEEITLRVDNETVTFNLDQTTRYSSTNDKSVNRIDIIDAVCEEYAPELLGFPNSLGGNTTLTFEPFTSEFILEEIEDYLKDDSISPEIDHTDCNPEEDICLIEKLLNNDSFQLPWMDLKQSEMTEAKSSIEEPPELELKDLSSHLEYAFLEENDKLPVINAKGLKNDEKDALLKVLKFTKGPPCLKITTSRTLKEALPSSYSELSRIRNLPFELMCDARKLKTRWSGPFTITKVFPYETVELSQPDGPNFKVNGHRVKHYFGGDLPPKEVQDLHTLPKDE